MQLGDTADVDPIPRTAQAEDFLFFSLPIGASFFSQKAQDEFTFFSFGGNGRWEDSNFLPYSV